MSLKYRARLNKILMKKLLVLLTLSLLVLSCGSKNRGELIGVKQKKWFGEKTLWYGPYRRWGVHHGEI